MYYEWLQRNKKRITLAVVGFFVFIIVWAVWTYIDRYGKTPLTISVVPSNATVRIDDRKIGNGTHWLADGTYKVKVEREGFESQESSIIVTADKDQNVLAVSLTPVSEEAQKWAAAHQRDYKKNEQYGAIEARENGKYFTDRNPITTKLPFTDPYFTLAYRTADDGSVVLTIDTPSPRYRFFAVEKIRELGYDPTDFVVEFRDFKNPLEKKR